MDVCQKKINKKINQSWNDLAVAWGFSSGESLRSYYKRHRKNKGLLSGDKTRVLCISDLHIPFQLDNLLHIFEEYRNKVDILVVNGDEQDCQSISRFRKKYRVSFVEELIETRKFFIDAINLIKPKKVIFNYGNHNARFINYMSDKLHEDILEILPNTNLDLIVVDGFFKHDRINGTKVFFEPLQEVINGVEVIYTNEWFNQVGDVVFCHPSAFKRSILKTSEDAWMYFKQQGFVFSTLVCSHTHMSGIYRYGDGFVVENGCLCKEQDYVKNGKFYRPQSNGMFYCVLVDDKFSYDDSKLVIL